MRKFWNWTTNAETGQRVLWLEGPIAEETWFGDEITPQIFREELFSGSGPVLIHVNSPGGDCIAASQIYAMLIDYKGEVTVQIDGIAASAASVICMAGTTVQMVPTALFMIHNPMTMAMGDADDFQDAIDQLKEFKEGIINAYYIKTGLPRDELSRLMDDETWMNAYRALELGFCDIVLDGRSETEESEAEPEKKPEFTFAAHATQMAVMNKLREKAGRVAAMAPAVVKNEVTETPVKDEPDTTEDTVEEPETLEQAEAVQDTVSNEPDTRVRADDLLKRLMLLK